MKVGLLLVTHNAIGAAISRGVRQIYANTIDPVAGVSLGSNLQPQALACIVPEGNENQDQTVTCHFQKKLS